MYVSSRFRIYVWPFVLKTCVFTPAFGHKWSQMDFNDDSTERYFFLIHVLVINIFTIQKLSPSFGIVTPRIPQMDVLMVF